MDPVSLILIGALAGSATMLTVDNKVEKDRKEIRATVEKKSKKLREFFEALEAEEFCAFYRTLKHYYRHLVSEHVSTPHWYEDNPSEGVYKSIGLYKKMHLKRLYKARKEEIANREQTLADHQSETIRDATMARQLLFRIANLTNHTENIPENYITREEDLKRRTARYVTPRVLNTLNDELFATFQMLTQISQRLQPDQQANQGGIELLQGPSDAISRKAILAYHLRNTRQGIAIGDVLQRRLDLILGNIAEATQGYSDNELGEIIAQARATATARNLLSAPEFLETDFTSALQIKEVRRQAVLAQQAR